jgi:hypothetical protein
MTNVKLSEKQRRPRYGYKGTETALNGLTGWMYEHVPMKGSTNAKYDAYLEIIVQYAEANIPGFKRRKGHLDNVAHFLARKIDANKKFNHFTNWVQNIYLKSLTQ